MKTAGEGGSWGMALLAAFMVCADGKALPGWLETAVFAGMEKSTLQPDEAGSRGFAGFMKQYYAGLTAEKKLGDE